MKYTFKFTEDLENNIIVVIGTPPILYLFVRYLFARIGEIHWIISVMLCLIYALLIAFWLASLYVSIQTMRTLTVVSLITSILVMAAAVSSSVSYTLHSLGLAVYKSNNEVNFGAFVDYYIWEFIDLIPGLHIWDTFNVKPPITTEGKVAGIPILLFRGLIALPLFALIKKWFGKKSHDKG